MNKLIILILCLSFQSYSQSMRDMIDEIFEQQREMMDKMMDDDFFDSMDSFGSFNSFGNIGSRSNSLNISSVIKKEDGKNFEVITIKADGEASSLEVDVDQMIRVSATITKTHKNQNSSFTSHSSSSQVFPIPENGNYRADKLVRKPNSVTLYFEVPEGQLAGQYGGQGAGLLKMRTPRLEKSFEDSDEAEDKAVILPQRKT